MTFGASSLGSYPLGTVPGSGESGGSVTLTINEATHSHSADSLSLTVNGSVDLVIADATHAHTADNVTLSTVADSITLTDIASYRVFQRSGTSASVTVSGTYTGLPSSIQARVVQHGTSTEVVGWTTIVSSPSGDAFSGSLNIPQGGWYNVQVRFGNSTGVVSNGANRFGVGIVVLMAGQSLMQYWFGNGGGTAVPLGAKHSGSVSPSTVGSWSSIADNAGAGGCAFAAALVAQFGLPVGMLNYAVGGSSITAWNDTTDTYFKNAIKGVSDCGGAVEYILWAQGEADASAGMARATYETYLTNTIANFRSQITNASGKTNLPFLISILGRGNGSIGTDDQASAIRQAQYNVAGSVADVYVAAQGYDLPLADTVHPTAAGFATFAGRYANTVKYLLGASSSYRGPYISGASQVDSTHTDVTVVHRGGSDFTPTTAINGFEIDDAGTVTTPSEAVRQSANVIRLTHTAVSGSATVRYAYGADAGVTYASTISNTVADNTSLALPLEHATSVSISLGTNLVINDATHAHSADSLTLSYSTNLSIDDAIHSHKADGLVLTLPGVSILTPEDIANIAAAVIAALNATTIPVNIKRVNDVIITGGGVQGDSMRPA